VLRDGGLAERWDNILADNFTFRLVSKIGQTCQIDCIHVLVCKFVVALFYTLVLKAVEFSTKT